MKKTQCRRNNTCRRISNSGAIGAGWGGNFYFLLKFALLWFGYLNFHPFLNLVFLAFLLFPLRAEGLHRARNIIAIPIGIALFYHDTWLPGVNSILSQGSQVAGFSAAYLLELVNRFINWQMVGAGFVLLVAYLFLSQWIRITVFTVAAIAWLNILTLGGPAIALLPSSSVASGTSAPSGEGSAPAAATLPPTRLCPLIT